MKYLNCLITYFFIQSVNAQEERLIVNLHTHQPVPFATVKILGKSQGAIASETGKFSLSIGSFDSVLISSVGYKSKYITGHQIATTIYLEPKVTMLKEIKVRTAKLTNTLTLGEDTSAFKSDLIWGPGGRAEFAQEIGLPDTKSVFKLKNVFFHIKKLDCYGPLLLHIYEKDSVTGIPGEELFIKSVNLSKSNVRKGKASIDLSSEEIYLENKSSFFIAISWLPAAGSQKCISALSFLQNDGLPTYSRSIASKDYSWHRFFYGKDDTGAPIPVNMYFSARVDDYK